MYCCLSGHPAWNVSMLRMSRTTFPRNCSMSRTARPCNVSRLGVVATLTKRTFAALGITGRANRGAKVENRPIGCTSVTATRDDFRRELLQSRVVAVIRHPASAKNAPNYSHEVRVDHRKA